MAVHFRVVFDRGADDGRGIRETVAAHDVHPLRLARHQLVGREVMLEPLQQRTRQIANVASLAPDIVTLEDGDDLVVRLAAVNDFQAADNHGAQDHLLVIDWTLADDADVERIAITVIATGGETANTIAAIGLRDKSIE